MMSSNLLFVVNNALNNSIKILQTVTNKVVNQKNLKTFLKNKNRSIQQYDFIMKSLLLIINFSNIV